MSRIVHLALKVDDLEQTTRFYEPLVPSLSRGQ